LHRHARAQLRRRRRRCRWCRVGVGRRALEQIERVEPAAREPPACGIVPRREEVAVVARVDIEMTAECTRYRCGPRGEAACAIEGADCRGKDLRMPMHAAVEVGSDEVEQMRRDAFDHGPASMMRAEQQRRAPCGKAQFECPSRTAATPHPHVPTNQTNRASNAPIVNEVPASRERAGRRRTFARRR
jgi:hypothetical protein